MRKAKLVQTHYRERCYRCGVEVPKGHWVLYDKPSGLICHRECSRFYGQPETYQATRARRPLRTGMPL